MVQRLTVLVTTACIAAMTVGCLKGVSHLDRVAALEKKSCACTDKACAEIAFNEFLTVAREIKKAGAYYNDADNKKLGEHTAAIIRCVMMKGVPAVTMQEELLKLKNYKPLIK